MARTKIRSSNPAARKLEAVANHSADVCAPGSVTLNGGIGVGNENDDVEFRRRRRSVASSRAGRRTRQMSASSRRERFSEDSVNPDLVGEGYLGTKGLRSGFRADAMHGAYWSSSRDAGKAAVSTRACSIRENRQQRHNSSPERSIRTHSHVRIALRSNKSDHDGDRISQGLLCALQKLGFEEDQLQRSDRFEID